MRAQTLITTSMLVSGLLIGATAPVAAQSTGNWGGFYVDGAIGFRNSTTRLSNQRIDTSYNAVSGASTYSTSGLKGDAGATNFLGQISAGWRWAPGPVVAGLGLFIDLAGNNVAAIKSPFSVSTTTAAGTRSLTGFNNIEVKQRDRYGLSLDVGPNWRTQPYAKVTYDWSNYNVNYNQEACGILGTAGSSGGSFSNTYTGFGLGGGVRHLQTDNLYFFAEVMWTGFGSKTQRTQPLCSNFTAAANYVPGTVQTASEQYTMSPTNVTGVIGVGYKF